jgi:hypothetical protein
MSHFSSFIAAVAIGLFSFAANASLFEIHCRVDENDRMPEFILLTEDHVNYTFAAFTIETRDKELEPRMVVTLQNEDKQNKFFASKKADGVLRTIRYEAQRLSMNSELFAELHVGAENRGDLVGSAQLLDADNHVLGNFICRRLN